MLSTFSRVAAASPESSPAQRTRADQPHATASSLLKPLKPDLAQMLCLLPLPDGFCGLALWTSTRTMDACWRCCFASCTAQDEEAELAPLQRATSPGFWEAPVLVEIPACALQGDCSPTAGHASGSNELCTSADSLAGSPLEASFAQSTGSNLLRSGPRLGLNVSCCTEGASPGWGELLVAVWRHVLCLAAAKRNSVAWRRLTCTAAAVSRTLRAAALGPGAPWETLHVCTKYQELSEERSSALRQLVLSQVPWARSAPLHGGGWSKQQLGEALDVLTKRKQLSVVEMNHADETSWVLRALSRSSLTQLYWSGRQLGALPGSLRSLSIGFVDNMGHASAAVAVMTSRVELLQRLSGLQDLRLELDLWQLSERHVQSLSSSLPQLRTFHLSVSAAYPVQDIPTVPDLRCLWAFPPPRPPGGRGFQPECSCPSESGASTTRWAMFCGPCST